MKRNILQVIRDSFWTKALSLLLIVVFTNELVFPTVAWALTSGPSQAEFTSFEPASTTDMVNLYTGDFTYNIPLLSVPGPNGGYPINLAYHSGVRMEDEASWVGLGWCLNVGAVSRQLQGLPDDFKGDVIQYELDYKKSWTASLDFDLNQIVYAELFNVSPAEALIDLQGSVYYNNYRGMGYRLDPFTLRVPGIPNFFTAQMGISYDSQSGLGLSPKLGINTRHFEASAQASISARNGLSAVSVSSSTTVKKRSYSPFMTTFPIAAPMPRTTMASKSYNLGFKIQVPTETLFSTWGGTFPSVISGNYNYQEALETEYEKPAYGYIYTHQSSLPSDVLDFQREDYSYSKKLPNLPPSQYTHDIFMVTGQGIGGAMRPRPSEVLKLNTSSVEGQIDGQSITGEVSFPAGVLVSIGGDYSDLYGENYSGPWESGVISALYPQGGTSPFTPEDPGVGDPKPGQEVPTSFVFDSDYFETAFFEMYGEKNSIFLDEDHLSLWGGDDAVRMILNRGSNDFSSTLRHRRGNSPSSIFNGNGDMGEGEHYYYDTRARRATNIENFSAAEADLYGFTDHVKYLNGATNQWETQFSDAGRKEHHLTELSILQPDGMRYNYELPVYNLNQKEAFFAVSSTENVNAVTVLKNETNTGGTLDEFKMVTEIPRYAHSWLLTSIVSTDYVDLTNDGLTKDDLGYWVKFNYKQTSTDYNWRVPYQGANLVEGAKNNPSDNKGVYTSGKKQLYYLESVATKTHIAYFEKSDREDGIGALSSLNGGKPLSPSASDRLQKLDKITLYLNTKPEYGTAKPVYPLKEVHFEYDYSRCPSVPNNTGTTVTVEGSNINAAQGKLTLKKVYTKELTSSKGRLSPYVFTYSTNNPSYDIANVDRWGNYKVNATVGNHYPFKDFPYTNQSSAPVADAWTLTKIQLPTGGEINVEYESDDYAYVENKAATQMYDIIGLESVGGGSIVRNVATPATGNTTAETSSAANNYRVYFNLNETVTGTSSEKAEYILNNVIKDLDRVYFKVYSDVFDGVKDYVVGYAEIIKTGGSDYYGIDNDGAYITLRKVPINETFNFIQHTAIGGNLGGYIHPFQKATIQHLRANRSELAFEAIPYSNSPRAQVMNLVNSIPGVLTDLERMIVGFNVWASSLGVGETIDLNGRSVIKLCTSTGKKYGGGSRVKRITIADGWENPTSSDNYTYGLDYLYEIFEDGRMISSGVAYEPQYGYEESALTEPINYTESTPLSASYKLFLEKPIMMKYYPSGNVGYRRVVVKSIALENAYDEDTDNELSYSRAPLSIYEFYTPKEFPILFDQTDISNDPPIKDVLPIPGISFKYIKKTAKSMGYSIVINDMAGKLHKVSQYDASQLTGSEVDDPEGKLISSQEYIYHTLDPYGSDKVNKLSSKVQVITEDGKYQTALVGQVHDIFVDTHEEFSRSSQEGGTGEAAWPGPIAAIIPAAYGWPIFYDDEVSYKTVVTNKIISRSAILKEVISIDYGSEIRTQNLAYDVETGEPLLTATNNEYNNSIYNYTYPAHWYYDGMGRASKNWKISIPGSHSAASNGQITITGLTEGLSEYFKVGDKVYLQYGSGSSGIFTISYVDDANDFIKCMDDDGQFLTGPTTVTLITVIRSGLKNMLYDNAGAKEAHTKNNFDAFDPKTSSTQKASSTTFSLDDVYNASVTEYSEMWQTYCCLEGQGGQAFGEINPYRLGVRGNWRPFRFRTYIDDRDEADGKLWLGGKFATFADFDWDDPASASDKWVIDKTIIKYSPMGFVTESKDLLERYSSSIYGHSGNILKATGANARSTELFFESFEAEDNPPFPFTGLPFMCFDDYYDGTNISSDGHTGVTGLTLGNQSYRTITIPFVTQDCSSPTYGVYSSSSEFDMDVCDCVGKFSPIPGKEYVFSAWTNQSNPFIARTFASNADKAKVTLKFFDDTPSLVDTKVITTKEGTPIIESWQQLTDAFIVPNDAVKMEIVLENISSSSNSLYTVTFDDIRIHPFNGSMKSYVYDSRLRLSAELDEYNFATFYNYDEQGMLTKVRKETIKGIKTVQETRKGLKQSN